MQRQDEQQILKRIEAALSASCTALQQFTPGKIDAGYKASHDPVTGADRVVNELLLNMLPSDGEGWLSEETTDDMARLRCERLWVVDPIDGTREFVAGIPEWCVSIAYVEAGAAVAGGICNPATGELFLGSTTTGVMRNGVTARVSDKPNLDDALVLASRSEVKRGEWTKFSNKNFRVQPMGSVAYKLARVAAGLADATFTLVPKHEWDVAAGVALVESAGGRTFGLDGSPITFNRASRKLAGLIGCGAQIAPELLPLLVNPQRAPQPASSQRA